eukprot:gene1999-17554_t
MSRRATFGGIVKRRLSGAFNASVKDVGSAKSKGSSASRPSSASRLTKTNKVKGEPGTMKDPRNLSNKGRPTVNTGFLQFLQINGFPHQISQKILQAPSGKEFRRVFEFLYGFIDKNDKIGPKWEEEVPRLLKQLRYPFPIAKSAMFTVGSLHTWPTLLGALHWLVNFIEMTKALDVDSILFNPNDECDPLSGCDRIIHQYYEKTYSDFMNDYNDAEDDLRLKEAILQHTGAAEDDTEALMSEVEMLRKRLDELEAEPDRLKEMQDNIAAWKASCEKIEREQDDLKQQTKIREIDMKNVDEELKRYDYRRFKQIQAAKNIEHQKEALTNKLKATEQENERLQAACWEREISYSKLYNKVDQTLKEYDDLWRNIKCNPRAMEYLQGVDIGMKIEHGEIGLKNASKFRDTIKETLIKAQNRVMSNVNQVESQIITEEEKMEKLTDLIKEKEYEIESMKSFLDAVGLEIEEAQKKAESEQKQAEEELASLKEEIKALEQGSSSLLDRKHKALAELKINLEKEREEMKLKKEKIAEFLIKVVKEAMEHKSKLKAGLSQVVQVSEKDLEELERKKKPSSL